MGQGEANQFFVAFIDFFNSGDQSGKFFLIINQILPGMALCISDELRDLEGNFFYGGHSHFLHDIQGKELPFFSCVEIENIRQIGLF
jgi:hypothetical protein